MSRHYAMVAVTAYPFERRFRLAYPRLLIGQTVALKDKNSVLLAVDTLERALTTDPTMADLMIPLVGFQLSLGDKAGADRTMVGFEKIAKAIPASIRQEIEAATSTPRRGAPIQEPTP